MSVLKPRTRLIYFRVSEEEFQKLNSVCQDEGARSMSDLARSAMSRLLEGGSERVPADHLRLLDKVLLDLNEKIDRLTHLIEGRPNGSSGERQ